jgi:hypothetical protein
MKQPSQAPVERGADSLGSALAAALRPMIAEEVRAALSDFAAAEAPTPALLSVGGLCAALDISETTLSRLRRLGLPTRWLLNSPRFDLAAVLAWVEARNTERAEHGE